MSTGNVKKMPPYKKAASDYPDSKALVVRRGDIFQYLVHLAAEDPAQIVQGRGGDRLVMGTLFMVVGLFLRSLSMVELDI